ncbi:MAG: hypothetical protein RJB08_651 [Actinomycetota bacterium]
MKIDNPNASRNQFFGIFATILFSIHNDKIGCELDDGSDVRIFRSTNMAKLRLLAEPRAGNRFHAPRKQRFGDAGYEADNAHTTGINRREGGASRARTLQE